MQSSQNLLRVTLQSVRDAVVTTDSVGRIQLMNRAAEDLTGWTEPESLNRPVEDVVNLREYGTDNPHPNPAYTALREVRKVEHMRDVLLVGKDGRRVGVRVSATPIDDEAGRPEGCLLVFFDASEALRLAERISYLAQHDSLTGLPNRILFVDRLEQGIRLSDRTTDQLAVIFVDLDHFDQVNRSFGTHVADQLLKLVAYRLAEALRESDTVCRLGADEFVLLVPGVKSIANLETLADKLLREISNPFTIDDHIVSVTCSIGISVYPLHASEAGTLMRLADGSMHKAKEGGRNRYLFAAHDSEGPVPVRRVALGGSRER
jgi:diguanylate cyclase (GGDEF)-like protein/PAS domain S-box-containing protein